MDQDDYSRDKAEDKDYERDVAPLALWGPIVEHKSLVHEVAYADGFDYEEDLDDSVPKASLSQDFERLFVDLI